MVRLRKIPSQSFLMCVAITCHARMFLIGVRGLKSGVRSERWLLGLVACCIAMTNYTHIHAAYSYADACRNIFNTIRISGHGSLEKIYLSLYSKVLLCERWVGDWTELQHIDPANSSSYNSISFTYSWDAQPGAWGPSLCWDMVLIPASSLQLICLPVTHGLYN